MRSASQSQRWLALGTATLLGWLVLTDCGQTETREPPQDAGQEAVPPGLHHITVGAQSLLVEIVQTDKERMQGLMFREKLPENQGMLFVFPQSHIQSFWMRNTFIPLDIAFINMEGNVIDIQRMEPLDEDKRYVSPGPVPYVLEVNEGWFESNAISVGAKVHF